MDRRSDETGFDRGIKPDQLNEGIAKFFPIASDSNNDASTPSSPSSGLPGNTLVPILRALREEIVLIKLKEAYSTLELRMVGGGLLTICEADWAHAEEGIK